MIIKKFSTKLNTLTMYAFRVVSTDKGKIKAFVSDLRSYIANDFMMRDYAPSTYTKALSKAQRLKVMRLRITKERGISNQLSLVTLVQRVISSDNHKGSNRDIERVRGFSHSRVEKVFV